MNFIVVGCGRVGAELAHRLYQAGHHVTVIDEVASAFENLAADFRGRTVEGEVLSPNVLHRAGIETADGVAAVTSSDSLNAVVARLAQDMYHTGIAVVRSYDPRQRLLLEAFGVQIVSPTSWGAQRIEELLTGTSTAAVFSPGNGEVEVYEVVVPESWNGRAVTDLARDGHRVVVAVARTGSSFLPSPQVRLQAGDVVYVSATAEGMAELQRQLKAVAEG